jgi:alkanesulfonate monooxygenase SsuD/methylene tetrahydromethanopterin reductase-like flavin-dependent oxidoreductase (luciferase family)
MKFHLFLPQMRLTFDRLVATAKAAEAAGFEGMAGMDHMSPPQADEQPMFEAMITNTWLAAHTERLVLSSLVLCDAFRHPGLLAKQAISIDHASQGRFEIGIGWGSWEKDFEIFGVEPGARRDRVERLRETLTILKALWANEKVDFNGRYNHLRGAFQAPRPLTNIPITIGGSGPKTLALIREFADWWNIDVRHLDKLEPGKFEELHERAGRPKVSLQEMVAFVPKGVDREAVAGPAIARFGGNSPRIGAGAELVDHFKRLSEQGVGRVYVWFCDFARAETLAAFGQEVISAF